MRREIIEALCRSATAEEAALARSCARGKGNVVADLIEAGLHRHKVLAACSEVTGIPRAPSAWFKDHAHVPLQGIDPEQCARHLFVPIAVEAGELCIAFGDPAVAVARDDLDLPPHQPYLATPTKVARAIKRLLARSSTDDTEAKLRGAASSAGESSAFSNKRRKKKRHEKRAASTEGVAVEEPPRRPSWEPTEELPPSPPPPPAVRAQPNPASTPQRPAAPRPPPQAPPSLRVLPPVRGADARSHGPLDPPLMASGAIDPPMPPAQPRTRAQQRAVRAGPKPSATPRDKPERKKPAPPPRAQTSTSSARTVLLALVLAVVGAAWFGLERARRGDGKRQDAPLVSVGEDGQVDLTARQRALIRRAQSEVSGVEAVNHLTSAINLDPGSEAARDAFLARARLYLAGGELERARRDLQRIQRRADAAPLRAEIDGLLSDLERRIGPGSDVAPQAADAGAPASSGRSPSDAGAP